MSKKIRRTISATLIISLIVLANFFLNLLTNYATNGIPDIVKKHPLALWILIGIVIITIIILNFWAETKENKTPESEVVKQEVETKNLEYSTGNFLPQYDVFISYSHKDSKFVEEKLIPFLKLRSFTYCVDKESFQTGSTSVEEIERCINQSRRVISVLTPAYLKSDWSKFENIMAQTLDPSAKNRKLIPILVEDCDLPSRFKMLHYRDLRANQSSQWDLLARDLA